MQVFVISLLRSQQRREHIKQELAKHLVTYNFFDAIEVVDLSAVPNYDFSYRQNIFGRHLRKGEIGCYLSHYTLWQKAVALNESICILEDDVSIECNNFNEILNTLEMFQDFDIVKLGGVFPRKFFLYKKVNNLQLVKYWFDNMGTQGYVITPHAARRLIENSAKIRTPVDDFMASYACNKLNILATNPPVLTHTDAPSELGGNSGKKEAMSAFNKIRREIYLQSKRISNLLFQTKYFLKVLLRII